jgi:DNA-binding NarL/FixJ family response regulator
MTAVRILVADDHEVVRQGLRTLLQTQPGWEVAWEAGTGREAVEIAKRVKPDVNVLDLSMPDMNGLEATRQILGHDSQSEVLILTMHESEQLIRDVLDAGARGYVLKSDAGRDLVAAVDALRQHKLFFTSKVASMVLAEYLKVKRESRNGSSSSSSLLSPREREIVQLLAEGKTNKEVSVTLNISIKTAETHRHHIMQKLELRSIADLVHYAIRNHIVAP